MDQLSDMSDNDDLTDDDNSFYSRTSEELARISRHKRSSTPPSLASPSLIPSTDILTNHHDALLPEDSLHPKRHTSASASSLHNYSVDLDFEDVSVGTDDFVGPIVEPSMKELKLLEDLVPADEDDPKFVLQPESVTIQEGEPVKLACRVAGTQPIGETLVVVLEVSLRFWCLPVIHARVSLPSDFLYTVAQFQLIFFLMRIGFANQCAD